MQLNFEEMQRRFLNRLRQCVQNGELTERGIARLAGISQPHLHNVLKGVRNLSPELMDLIFKCLDFSMLDLCMTAELKDHREGARAEPRPLFDLPFASGAIGPGQPWPVEIDGKHRNPVLGVTQELGRRLALARLSPDDDMEYSSLGASIAILDLSDIETYSTGILYVVDRGHDAVLRGIRVGLQKVYLVADADAERPERWEPLATPSPSAVVRARVCRFLEADGAETTPRSSGATGSVPAEERLEHPRVPFTRFAAGRT